MILGCVVNAFHNYARNIYLVQLDNCVRYFNFKTRKIIVVTCLEKKLIIGHTMADIQRFSQEISPKPYLSLHSYLPILTFLQ